MKNNFLTKLFFILFIPLLLISAETKEPETTQAVQNENNNLQKSIEDKILEQQKITDEIIKKINEETYINETSNERSYDNEINYLQNRITINQRAKNTAAVKRDEIKLLLLQEKRFFENTLREIIYSKRSFKEKEYFTDVLKSNIELLENNSEKNFEATYELEKNKDNKISKELVLNYLELQEQSNQQLFTLKYMVNNISLFRKTNFFIDKFNIQYLIEVIDSQPIIASISEFMKYNLKFTIGEILVVLFIMGFFRLLNTKIITLLTSFVTTLFIKQRDEEEYDLRKYIKKSMERPLVFALYVLSIQISLYILIKDTALINKIIPWINTLYMGLLTWAMYSLLSNSITNYAQHLVEKYPNVRREMIIFILRIIKIILILIVILFLFSQLGIDIKAIAASLGVGGIAIALASKDTLANFFGSLNIMTDNSFSQGDWIVSNDVEGTVVDIRMRTTRIRTFDNAMITVPNSELANSHIKNYSKRKIGRRIKMKLGITYESKMDDIVNLKNDIHEMLSNHPHIASAKNSSIEKSRKFEAIKREDLQGVKRTLLVYIDEYSDSSINILIYCFTRSPNWEDWLTIKEDVLIKISELVIKNNCDFAYPTQTLFVKR